MTYPTVHTNGTSKADLIASYEATNHAITKACEALAETAPNMRDYYHQGDAVFKAALNAYQMNLNALHSVQHHIQYLWESVDGQEG